MLIDFEKAFDSISWKFLIKTFELFNFGKSMINWITPFNTITAGILQCDNLSTPLPIKEGCKQGDPT